MELAEADSEAFGRPLEESKDKGTIGFLTDEKLKREKNIKHACQLALIPFLPRNSKWWPTGTKSDAGGGASS